MLYNIVPLAREVWLETRLNIDYTSYQHYAVRIANSDAGYTVNIVKEDLDEAFIHRSADCEYPDKLYADYREDAYAWGVIVDKQLIAAIETMPEPWSNRLRICELWVHPDYRRQGVAQRLMALAKEQLRRERRRVLILETQSSNVNAVDFYRAQGFTLIGFDSCCYRNDDIARGEVRLEFGWFPQKKNKLTQGDIEIRPERLADYHATERMTQRAFWNKHHRGCNEHYLVHKLRSHPDYLPALSRVALKDGQVIGAIFYSSARVVADGAREQHLLSFGPLCVAPEWQGCGVGERLVKETVELARRAGHKGIVIFGDPDYYPRLGFKSCDVYRITTAEGKNFSAFMALELHPDSLADVAGKFYNSTVFDDLPDDAVEAYNTNFPPLEKQHFPGQWD